MLAVTLSLVILNKFRNRELRKELAMSTKGKVTEALDQLFLGEDFIPKKKVFEFISEG